MDGLTFNGNNIRIRKSLFPVHLLYIANGCE